MVDLRGYGEWGEWHSGYRYADWDTRVNALKWLLDAWCGAWKGDKKLFLSYSHETELGVLTNGRGPTRYEEYLSFSALDYAVETFPAAALGFRRDGVAGAITGDEKRFSGTLYQGNRMQIAEFCNGYAQYKQEGKSIRACINEALELHPNYMVLMGWDKNGGAADFYKNELEEIKYALKNMGYRMVLEKASYPTAVSKGRKLSVSTDWVNMAFGVLPDGYTLHWQGEKNASDQSMKYLFKNFPLAIILMIAILIMLFKDYRKPIIIFCSLPMLLVGVVAVMLLTDKTFNFVAIVGTLGLIGMLIKNGIVLMDEITLQINAGIEPVTALIDSSQSRLRPVMMASLTTILGMIPLLSDAMFGSLAAAIMGGLLCSTLITLLFIPILYALFFKIRND